MDKNGWLEYEVVLYKEIKYMIHMKLLTNKPLIDTISLL